MPLHTSANRPKVSMANDLYASKCIEPKDGLDDVVSVIQERAVLPGKPHDGPKTLHWKQLVVPTVILYTVVKSSPYNQLFLNLVSTVGEAIWGSTM